MVASVSVYLVAYRYYSLYIAQKVMKLDPTRATPAVINNDGLNYGCSSDQPLRVVWSPLRRYRRCWSAGGTGSRRADGLPAWTLWLLAG
ncbi:carbon starvation CstA family protein [Shigella flexneri]